MKINYIFSILILFLFSFTDSINAQNHVVKKGETVYSIAHRYGVSDQEIYRLNPSAVKGIKEGQDLQIPSATASYQFYTVKTKETIYGISKANNISVQELLDLNPTLSTTNLKDGQTIKIPSKPIEHKVIAKETLYGISRTYGITEEALKLANPQLKDGLKKGMTLSIPFTERPPVINNTIQADQTQGFPKTDTKTLRVGILLPLTSGNESLKTRFIEYYRGFLIALQEIKAKGYSMDIYAFDIGSKTKLHALLESSDIKDLHLIIGGVTEEDVQILSDYTRLNNIKYVIPFPVKGMDKLGENCFVVTRPNQELEYKAIDYYSKNIGSNNIIILKDDANNKNHFVSKLKTELDKRGKTVTTINYSLSLKDDLLPHLSEKTTIIPASDTQSTLSKLIPVLKSINSEYPGLEVQLFGYPNWQAYGQFQEDLKLYNAVIFSSFFIDESSYWVKVFNERFEKWYNTSTMKVFPKYGVLGYDTGIYFLTALARNGFDFEKKILKSDVNTLQTAFKFLQSKDNGFYINDGLYIIKYSESDIKKENYSK